MNVHKNARLTTAPHLRGFARRLGLEPRSTGLQGFSSCTSKLADAPRHWYLGDMRSEFGSDSLNGVHIWENTASSNVYGRQRRALSSRGKAQNTLKEKKN